MKLVRERIDDGETWYRVLAACVETDREIVLGDMRIVGRLECAHEVTYYDNPFTGARRRIGLLTRAECAATLRRWRRQCQNGEEGDR